MYQPTAEYLLRQARRNQMFSNAPMGMGQCPLKLAEVAIFPVRYALDESPSAKGSHQGAHAFPAGWSRPPPALQTRSYTLRQLRDGWLPACPPAPSGRRTSVMPIQSSTGSGRCGSKPRPDGRSWNWRLPIRPTYVSARTSGDTCFDWRWNGPRMKQTGSTMSLPAN